MDAVAARTLRVLIVEDSETDAALTLLPLRRAGMPVEAVRVDTPEALHAALDGREWDVVLSDYTLPKMTGRMALDIVREQGKDVPFIIVSGSLGEDRAVEMMRAGAHDFFPKGTLKRLPAAIEREVREAELRRDRAAEQQRAEEERQRLVAELRQAVHARDTFIALAAHELRTPLTSAFLKLDQVRRWLHRDGDAVNLRSLDESLGFVSRQQRRLALLIENLMEVAAIASGGRAMIRTPVDLADEVHDAFRFLEEETHASGSTVSVRAEEGIVGQWDRTHLRAIVRNLLANAIKYGAGRPIEVSASRAGNRARLVVVDHGVGIPPEERARVFNRFEYAVPEHHHGGFGLGLWVVRRAVEEHGGTIDMTSEEGKGSTFRVELPL